MGDFMKYLLLGIVATISVNSFALNFLDFSQTCSSILLERASVSANCKAENGGVYKTSLRLRGINNHNGVLRVEADTSKKSTFHDVCRNTGIDDYGILYASCPESNGRYRASYIDLKDHISNFNGSLVYPN